METALKASCSQEILEIQQEPAMDSTRTSGSSENELSRVLALFLVLDEISCFESFFIIYIQIVVVLLFTEIRLHSPCI